MHGVPDTHCLEVIHRDDRPHPVCASSDTICVWSADELPDLGNQRCYGNGIIPYCPDTESNLPGQCLYNKGTEDEEEALYMPQCLKPYLRMSDYLDISVVDPGYYTLDFDIKVNPSDAAIPFSTGEEATSY